MASTDGKSHDGDDPLDPPLNEHPPGMSVHSLAYPGVPVHMYPFPPGLLPTQPLRSKRRQVKNACTNCQKACKKCDDARPCLRCVKYGIGEECIDSQRKERKKGIKRGPYKKRDGKGVSRSSVEQSDASPQPGLPVSHDAPSSGGSSLVGPYGPIGLSSGFYGQYPPATPPKPTEGVPLYPQYFLTPLPHLHPHGSQDPEGHYATSHPFYPGPFVAPYPPVYPQYMMHARADGGHFAYGPTMYHKSMGDMGFEESGSNKSAHEMNGK
ncbi:hypothetical protein BDN72DRAFT_815960 [Pluteus cervinus]|uniref:Uncharacterized protein n=1 Tax=Pluteus cervinus TaxID=181527 RepID=A0ACD3B3Z1_9AGAR|nr:hypothetical protein BDN72DRAFT_815960 [Pluteus cervinus]